MKFACLLGTVALAAGSAANAQVTPPPPGWQATIDRYLEGRLKDPMSAVKKVTRGPRQGSVKSGFASSWYGWAVCYDINSKNTYGGYGGFKRFVFVIDDKGVVGMLSDEYRQEDEISYECAMPADAASASAPLTAL